MKTEVRKKIGGAMIWTGIAVLAGTQVFQLSIKSLSGITLGMMHQFNWVNLVAVAVIIIGGLWGMKK